MAIIKVAKGGKTLSQAINYAGKEDKTIGKDISDQKQEAIEEMKITKELYNKTEGRQYKHYIQSFKKDEVNILQAQKIGLKFAEKNFKGYEVFIGTHTDRNHIHNHMIVNSVNFETGKKFNATKDFLVELKKSNDEISKIHGLDIVQKKEISGEVRAYSQEKYQALKKGFEGKEKSYILQTAQDLKKVIPLSKNKSELIKNMSMLGYKTNWTETRKHITFTNSDGNKVRLSNLEKTFSDNTFSKGGLNNEFERNIIQARIKSEPTRAYGVNGDIERNTKVKRADEELHINAYGQTGNSEINDRQRAIKDTENNPDGNGENDEYKQGNTAKYDFDFEEATRNLIEQQRRNAEDFGELQDRDKRKQPDDGIRVEEHKRDSERSNDRSQQEIKTRDSYNREQDKGYDMER